MTNPKAYEPTYNFTSYQALNPTKPLPAPRIDEQFNNIAQSMGQTVDALADIRRSDGKLVNGIVGPDAISPSLSLGFSNAGQWTFGNAYQSGDGVVYAQKFYRCQVTHVATAGTRPDLSPTTWAYLFSVADLVIPGHVYAFRKAYVAATAYAKDDVVTYGGSSWIALGATTGNAPPDLPATENAYWALMASRGAGDVNGPATAIAGNVTSFSDTTGKQLKDSGIPTTSVIEAMRGYISPGRTLHINNNTGNPANAIDVTAGSAASDGTDPFIMTTAGFIGKRLDQAWAVGAGNGCWLDGASMPNGTGHIFLIQRSDTGIVDLAASASISPTLPTPYDRKRRIGSIRRVSGAIIAFTQNGDEFLLSSTVIDFVVNNYGSGGIVRTLSVPVGIFVTALCSFSLQNQNSIGSSNEKITSLEQADIPTDVDNCDLKLSAEGAWSVSISTHKPTRTNLSAQIRTRGLNIGSNHWYSCTTHGWIDKRGKP